jgi:hypothetical protein
MGLGGRCLLEFRSRRHDTGTVGVRYLEDAISALVSKNGTAGHLNFSFKPQKLFMPFTSSIIRHKQELPRFSIFNDWVKTGLQAA